MSLLGCTGGNRLTVNEEQNREQPACKVDSIVQGLREVKAGDSGKSSIDKLLLGLFICKVPVLEEVPIDLCRHRSHKRMAYWNEEGRRRVRYWDGD